MQPCTLLSWTRAPLLLGLLLLAPAAHAQVLGLGPDGSLAPSATQDGGLPLAGAALADAAEPVGDVTEWVGPFWVNFSNGEVHDTLTNRFYQARLYPPDRARFVEAYQTWRSRLPPHLQETVPPVEDLLERIDRAHGGAAPEVP